MKKVFLYLTIAIATMLILWATVIKNTNETKVVINAPFKRIYNQIASINNYTNWYTPFKQAPKEALRISGKNKIETKNKSLEIDKLFERSCLLNVTENGENAHVLFTLTEDTLKQMTVVLTYKSSWWHKYVNKKNVVANAETSLQQLKLFCEDTKAVYGYNMREELVTDTTFLFTSTIVSKSQKEQTIKQLYTRLIDFAAKKDAGFTGTRILYVTPVGTDSVRLHQSIVVTKNIQQLPIMGSMSIKRMPYQKNLLVADYTGKLQDIDKVFAALELCSIDDKMISMAIPYIKLSPTLENFNDTTTITGLAYFPIK
jgi:hypothetical protein